MDKRYSTKQVAKTIGIGHQTLLRWLYAKKLTEPERIVLNGMHLRLWTKADIQRALKYKREGAASRRSRKLAGATRKKK